MHEAVPVNIIRAERLYAIRSRVPPVIKWRWRSGAVVVRLQKEVRPVSVSEDAGASFAPSATERRVFVTALVAVASHIWAGAMAFVVALGKQASGTVKPRNPRHFDSFGGERIGIKK